MLKLSISERSASAAAMTAVAARAFIGLAVETRSVHNGAWISALLGGLLSVPWVLALGWLASRRLPLCARALPPLELALLAALVLDAARVFSAVSRSADYLAQDRSAPVALLIPACLAALWCASRGGSALGYGAMIWARLFPAGMALVVLLQFRHYRPEWLLPVLGPGWRGIALGGVQAAERVMLASGVLLTAGSEGDSGFKSSRLLRTLALSAGIAALLIVLRLMMTPTMLKGDGTFLDRLDSLLVNGRAPLYLQLPMIALWFAGLMHLLACECFAASALLQKLLPRFDGRLCAALTALSAGLLSLSPALADAGYEPLAHWIAVALPLCASFALVVSLRNKGGATVCAR